MGADKFYDLKYTNCDCMNPPFIYARYDTKLIGCDMTNGRFGDVTIKKCKKCNNIWLHYFVEYESFSKLGRWYQGLISESDVKEITPENAVEYLEKLEWYFYGGSYFDTIGKMGNGKPHVDS